MREERLFTVYIVTNTPRGVLYVGVTSDLLGRVQQHRDRTYPGFSSQWGLRRLVWYQIFDDAESAIHFEKRLKRWRRQWKFELIERMNPEWDDLWEAAFRFDSDAPGGPG
ncbi:GIY-YIG nuclease family protein [Brevundimonas naejangsanensis]